MKIKAAFLALLLLVAATLCACPTPADDTVTVSLCYDLDHDGVAEAVNEELVFSRGERVLLPSLADPGGKYEEIGWQVLNGDGTRGRDFGYFERAKESLTLICKWGIREFDVSFYIEGYLFSSTVVPYGEAVLDDPYPTDPSELTGAMESWRDVLAGKTFLGWQDSEGTMWDIATTPVTDDLRLTAVFAPDGEGE